MTLDILPSPTGPVTVSDKCPGGVRMSRVITATIVESFENLVFSMILVIFRPLGLMSLPTPVARVPRPTEANQRPAGAEALV